MAIRVKGEVTLKVPFTVDLNMTEEEYNAMNYNHLMLVLDRSINWEQELPQSSLVEVDTLDVEEV